MTVAVGRPESVHIGLYTYPVIVENERLESEDLYGQICYPEQKIVIRDDISQERQAVTLLHEVLHGVLEHVGLVQDRKLEEFITASAPGLVETMRRNPDLVRFILGSEFVVEAQEA